MKVVKRLGNVLGTLLVVTVVALAILLVGVRAVGLTPFSVLSGSMEPVYPVGSLIYVQQVAPQDVQVGDVISFIVNEDLLVATHRVIGIERLETEQVPLLDESTGEAALDPDTGEPLTQEVPLDEPLYYYQTKGDANDAADGSPVHYKNLLGTPVLSIPYLGYLSSWLRTRQGMILGGSIALTLIILTFLPDLLGKADEADQRAAQRSGHRAKRRGAER